MKEPIRVLQVFSSMGCSGGAEVLIMNLYRNIDRTKIQFDFVVHTKDKYEFDDEIRELGGRIYSVPAYTGKNHFSYKKAWHELFKAHPEFKIIHGHVRSTASIYLKIAKEYGLTTIVHSHSTSSGKGFNAIAKNILQFPVRYISDYLFACSDEAGKWLFGEASTKKDNYRVLKNGIDIDKYVFDESVRNKVRKDMNLENKYVVGHVGRFDLEKNHSFLINIFYEIHMHDPNAILLLIGDGGLRPQIERKINHLSLSDNVILTGIVINVNNYMQAMDAFVFPSIFEGLPITLVEAQASGLTCFVSDTITKEVKLTSFIKYMNLNMSPLEWATEILKSSKGIQRCNCTSMIAEAGFDIRKVAYQLSSWYAEISNVSKG